MAKVNKEQQILSSWWVRAIMAVIFLGMAYGFASLAIDSGSLLEYTAAIGFFIWALRSAWQAIRTH